MSIFSKACNENWYANYYSTFGTKAQFRVIVCGHEVNLELPKTATARDLRNAALDAYDPRWRDADEKIWEIRDNDGVVYKDDAVIGEVKSPVWYASPSIGTGA